MRQALGRGWQGGAGSPATAQILGGHQQADLWTRPEPQKERVCGMSNAEIRDQRAGINWERLRDLAWVPLLVFFALALGDLLYNFGVAWAEWYRAGGLQ
jgi:hypothetical protein